MNGQNTCKPLRLELVVAVLAVALCTLVVFEGIGQQQGRARNLGGGPVNTKVYGHFITPKLTSSR